MKTEKEAQRGAGLDGELGGAKRTQRVTTRVRTRCNGRRSLEEEVGEQMAVALPQIVRAQVKKAKAGSLQHTRWLWSVAEKASGAGDAGKAKASLAELLMEQLGQNL